MSRLETKKSAPEQKDEFAIFTAEALRIEQQGVLTPKDSANFKLIYEAAKNPDKVQAKLDISKLLNSTKGMTIDSSDRFFKGETPAYRLAKEGNTESAEFLREEFKAEEEYIIFGYAEGGHVDEANKLLAYYPPGPQGLINLRDQCLAVMIQGYAKGGHFQEVNRLLDQNPDFDFLMVVGYAAGKHVTKVNQFLEHNFKERSKFLLAVPQTYTLYGHILEAYNLLMSESVDSHHIAILDGISLGLNSALFHDETTALHILVIFKPEDQKYLINKLKKSSKLKICKDEKDIKHLLSKASHLHQLMLKHQINFDQALAWINEEVQFLLAKGLCRKGKQSLSQPVCRLISTFLVSNTLNHTQDLAEKQKAAFEDHIVLAKKQEKEKEKEKITKIMSPLKVYSNPGLFSFSHHHIPRAKALIEFADQSNDLKEVTSLLQNQKSLLDGGPAVPFQSPKLDKRWTDSVKTKNQGKFYSALQESLKIAETSETPVPKS